jgi:hypothetical protein
MKKREHIFGLPPVSLVIILGALVKFAIHLIHHPGYGMHFDEYYTIALSRHLAFGYVDLPPLVPALVALSRALLGESILAFHIFPALAGAATLVFVCLITQQFGGKTLAVGLSALAFIAVPLWLGAHTLFCYDGIDQLVLSAFLYILVRFLQTEHRKLWIQLGLIAGIACMTKATILFMGPGFVVALLASKQRKDLLTRWPWLGGLVFIIVVSPYLIWQFTNQWPSLEYWMNYGTGRMYQADLTQYLMNLLTYMYFLLLPLWLAGLYRIFRPFDGRNYSFLGVMFLATFVLMFVLHSPTRMLAALFMPILAAGAVFFEELVSGRRWEMGMKIGAAGYLIVIGVLAALLVLPIMPPDRLPAHVDRFKVLYHTIREFRGVYWQYPPTLSGRLGWDGLVEDVAAVYDALPEEDRAIAGIYSDWYMPAGAIDMLGPQYDLPHAVSGSLTYYLWGPGYSWEVMVMVGRRTNDAGVFFEECELKHIAEYDLTQPVNQPYIYVCRKPKVTADVIWGGTKNFR